MPTFTHEAKEADRLAAAAIKTWRETGVDSAVSLAGDYWAPSVLAGQQDAKAPTP